MTGDSMAEEGLTKLMGLRYKIVYRKGVENRAAEALSRLPGSKLLALPVAQPKWLTDVVKGYQDDPVAKNLLQRYSGPSTSTADYSVSDGVIRYKGRVWLGSNASIQQQVLQALHSSPTGGHSGIHATYDRAKRLFAWPHMKQDIIQFVSDCATCKQAKTEHVRSPGLLEPLPIPHAWHTVTMDFVDGLPLSKGYSSIW